jgi:hypothetical protein
VDRRFARVSLVIFIILTLIVVAPRSIRTVSAATLPTVGIWSSTCGSVNVTVTNSNCGPLGVNSFFTIQVNVTNPPPNLDGHSGFNAYEFMFFWDPAYLQTAGVDGSTNTLCNNPTFAKNDTITPGTLRVAVANLGDYCNLSNAFSGVLVNVKFNILKLGVSPIVLAASTTQPSAAVSPKGDWTRLASPLADYLVQTSDGYFKNDPAHLGPVASFTYSPQAPLRGGSVTFDATRSYDAETPSFKVANITTFLWDFSDGVSTGGPNPVVQHVFGTGAIGNFSVRLTVVDKDNGFEGMKTALVSVGQIPFHDMSVDRISVPANAKPGDQVSITIFAKNVGTYTETYNLTVTVGPPTTTLKTFLNQTLVSTFGANTHTFTVTWNTTGWSPGGYQVTATITDPLDQNPANNSKSGIISLAGESSSPLLVIALGAVAAVVVVAVAGVLLRKRRASQQTARDAL